MVDLDAAHSPARPGGSQPSGGSDFASASSTPSPQPPCLEGLRGSFPVQDAQHQTRLVDALNRLATRPDQPFSSVAKVNSQRAARRAGALPLGDQTIQVFLLDLDDNVVKGMVEALVSTLIELPVSFPRGALCLPSVLCARFPFS